MTKFIPIVALFALCSCSALLTPGGISGIAGQVDNLVPELVLQKYQALHNLKAGMMAIDATPGPVTMVMPPPVVVAPGPVPAPVPVPVQ